MKAGRSDIIIERIVHAQRWERRNMFLPRIAVELKSLKEESLTQALNQSIKAVKHLSDRDLPICLIIMKGTWIGFFGG